MTGYSPIQRKLIRIILMACVIVVVLTSLSFFAFEFYTFRNNTKQQLSTLGKVISKNSTAALAFQSTEEAFDILSSLSAEEHIIGACLFDAEGKLFSVYPAKLDPKFIPFTSGEEGLEFTRSYLHGFIKVEQDGAPLGSLYLVSDLKAVYDRFYQYGLMVLLITGAALISAFILSRRLQRTISVPIMSLADTVTRVSTNKDYTIRAKKYDEDELGVLTDSFNHMLSTIEQQNQEITRFNQELERKVKLRTTELKIQKEFAETLVDASVDVIAVFDRELRYVMLNKCGEKLYGSNGIDPRGNKMLELFPQVEGSEMHKELLRAFEGEFIRNPKYHSKIADKYFENFFIPLKDGNGNINRVMVIGHDITEIVETSNKLTLLNSELGKSNSELEQFAYIASHDLQEPLRKIITFSDLIQHNLSDTEKTKQYLEKVIGAARRMTKLIRDVLDFSRLSGDKGPLKPVSLNHVLENIRADLELLIQEKNAELKISSLPVVTGNEIQLQQLFLNLINNSLKFNNGAPQIVIKGEITSKRPEGIISDSRKFAMITVQDNGIGFDQSLADKVFTVFQRLHSNEKYPGTGIGLAISKKIVDNHQGKITASSEEGKGTIFTIWLPVVN